MTLKVVDPDVTRLDLAGQEAFVRAIAARLDKEGVAYDIAFHRDAPPHFRIWAGATIEAADLAALTEWLEWGYAVEKAALEAGGVACLAMRRPTSVMPAKAGTAVGEPPSTATYDARTCVTSRSPPSRG